MGRYPTREELARLIRDYFEGEQIEYSYDPQEGQGEASGAVFWVHNLTLNLARVDRADWPEYVAWHFRHLAGGPPDIPSDYRRARRMLRVRLAPTVWVDRLPDKEMARPVADDLHQALMVKIDDGAAMVPLDSVETWGIDPEQMWADARKNTMLDEPRERRAMLKPTGERLTWVRGSWWVSSLLLDLGRYLSVHNRHGALAMVPVRDALFFHEITDASVVHSMGAMLEFGLQLHFEDPDPISPHIYWWRGGSITRVVAYEDGRNRPVWGDEFRASLAEVENTSTPAATVMN